MAQTRFTLGTFDEGTGTFPGLVVDETVYDARQVVPHPTVAALLTDWATSLPALTPRRRLRSVMVFHCPACGCCRR